MPWADTSGALDPGQFGAEEIAPSVGAKTPQLISGPDTSLGSKPHPLSLRLHLNPGFGSLSRLQECDQLPYSVVKIEAHIASDHNAVNILLSDNI